MGPGSVAHRQRVTPRLSAALQYLKNLAVHQQRDFSGGRISGI
jgi:hypothetical protein